MSSHGAGQDGAWRGERARIRLPLLDRLIDLEPDVLRDAPLSAADALVELRRSVRRDLEALLNARRPWRSWSPELKELATSPVGYGLPDYSAGAFNERQKREELRAEIEACILRFEPRFVHVSVILQPGEKLSSSLRLRIEALLHAEPAPEPIAFDTVMDPATTDVTVTVEES